MEFLAYRESAVESYQAAIDRGVASTGTPYSASALNAKRSDLARAIKWRDETRSELAALQAIPTYREWRAMVRK
jgi:hypothetical protein